MKPIAAEPETATPADGATTEPKPIDLQKLPPNVLRKLAKIMRDRAPKHENFHLCHKKCKNFKPNRCFVLAASAQKECWFGWHDEKGNVTGEPPTIVNEPPKEVSLAPEAPKAEAAEGKE